jgi:hypothetical protein
MLEVSIVMSHTHEAGTHVAHIHDTRLHEAFIHNAHMHKTHMREHENAILIKNKQHISYPCAFQ